MSILQLKLGTVNVWLAESPCPDTLKVRIYKFLNDYKKAKELNYHLGYNHHYKVVDFPVGVKHNPKFAFDAYRGEWRSYEDVQFSFHKVLRRGVNHSGYKRLQNYELDRYYALSVIKNFIRRESGVGTERNKYGYIVRYCPINQSPIVRNDIALNITTRGLSDSMRVLEYLSQMKLPQKRNPPFEAGRGLYWFNKKAVKGIDTAVVEMKQIKKFEHQATRVITAYIPENADNTVRLETRSIGLEAVKRSIFRLAEFGRVDNNLEDLTEFHTINQMFWQDVLPLFSKAQQKGIKDRYLLDTLPSFKDACFQGF